MAMAAASTSPGVTLIISTTSDPASTGQATALLARTAWDTGPSVEGRPTWSRGALRLWQLSTPTVFEDDLDGRWERTVGEGVKEVIFMSKHSAASSKPALTVHPIGVPHLAPDDIPQVGGRPGKAPPPCPRLGPWFRLLRTVAAERGLMKEFEVTLEGTHHGPDIRAPSMFVEIGSTEEYWGRTDAADALAEVFIRGLGIDGGPGVGDWDAAQSTPPEGGTPPKKTVVMLGLGGGHYCPRHLDVAKKEGVWLGHILPGYAMPMVEVKVEDGKAVEVGGRWRESILEAVSSTRAAFPHAEVKAHIDSKSLKGWQRTALQEFLQKENIPVGTPQDFTMPASS